MRDILCTKVKEKGLVDKSAISGFINNADLNNKSSEINSKTKLKSRLR